ncbi:MAG: carbonic anhydrase, partial [bacterium]
MDKFATAITCIDGRIPQPVSDWVKLQFNVHYVDLITEPGPDKVLSDGDENVIGWIVARVKFSLEHHHSEVVILSGHGTCAANPVPKEEHYKQIVHGAERLLSYDMPATIIGIWVNESGSVDLVWDS